jgi:hypothetical protein
VGGPLGWEGQPRTLIKIASYFAPVRLPLLWIKKTTLQALQARISVRANGIK